MSKLPIEILTKVFMPDGSLTKKIIPFIEQVYILTQSGISNLFIHIEDSDSGLSVEDFLNYKKDKSQNRVGLKEAQENLDKGVMVVSGKDIADYVNHLNGVSASGSLNYSLKLKKTKEPKIPDIEGEFITLCKLLSNYESNKKNIIHRAKLTMPDLYVLLYLHDGSEKNGTHIYRQHFAQAINSSRFQFLQSYKKLISMGYISRIGKAKHTKYKITYLGKGALMDVIKKYVII